MSVQKYEPWVYLFLVGIATSFLKVSVLLVVIYQSLLFKQVVEQILDDHFFFQSWVFDVLYELKRAQSSMPCVV